LGLIEQLGAGPVALDTQSFIYLLEEHPIYCPRVLPVFTAIDEGKLTGITSAVTLLEVLVVPYRAQNLALAERYETLLLQSQNLSVVELSFGLLRLAAQLRAELGLRTPDALQVAAGLSRGCSAFLTNDSRIPERIGEMRVVQLDQP
jgi:predicted nucleic acid-binding protein